MATFLAFAASVLVVIGAAALVWTLLLYLQFRSSPEAQWKADVLSVLADAERCVRAESGEMDRLGADERADAGRLRDEAFESYLAAIAVGELDAYPGIGPATVGKLRDAGYDSLAVLRRARINIHGLGRKRLADIAAAVRDLVSGA